MSIIYEINRGVNKPIEFKGLRAQWILWLGAGIGVLLLLFAIGYMAGVNLYACIAVVGLLGCGLFSQIYSMSRKYGEYGFLKLVAYKRVPSAISCSGRLVFIRLTKQ